MHRKAILVIAASLALTGAAQAQTFDTEWFTVDGGGGTFSTGGAFSLGGTVGQLDAGVLAGGAFTLTGGFWAVASSASPPCPGERGDSNCNGSTDFFDIDPFLQALFDLPAYQATHCGGSICAADADCSGAVDFFDIDPFLACVFGACGACP